jgi:beta-glucosidase
MFGVKGAAMKAKKVSRPKSKAKSAGAKAKSSGLPAYKNPKLSAETRVKDLLKRMTLQEKAAQMICLWVKRTELLSDPQGNFDLAKAQANFKKCGWQHGLGQVGRPSDWGAANGTAGLDARQMAQYTNDIQKFFMENSRLGIPVFFHEECLHGHSAKGGTSFPVPVGLAGTFNPALVQELFAMTALETRVRGGHQALTPVVDVAREPRWGRVEETYGEDPYLVARMGVAAVKGFQGDATFENKDTVIACLKHFVAHGQPEGGMNCAPANVSMRVLRETFLSTFKAGVQEGGALSVMASYNEVDGVPSHANKWLLRDVLRDEWGFKGFVVSDYFAIWELNEKPDTHGHFLARDKAEAAKLAVEAGVNIELPDGDCYLHLVELVKKGRLKEKQLDELVAEMLLWKFKMGIFDDPFVDPDEADRIVGCEEHAALALKAARETITLLKNDGSLAPLDLRKLKSIAVIGPNAGECLLGGYSGIPQRSVSVLDGIKAHVGGAVKGPEVLYAEGCKIMQPGTWFQDEVFPSNADEDRQLIIRAVEVAQKAEVIVLCLGGNHLTSREAWNLKHMGDRARLELIGRQMELVDALRATGKPIIVFLFNGRPLAIGELLEKVPVVFECWYLGQESGVAVAEVLFGDYNPGGKLPMSFPRSAGHLPVYYNYKPSARRGYLMDDVTPLLPFGFGLSYTQFEFGKPRLEKVKIKVGGATRVLVEVTNVGACQGTEVVQMYIRDRFSTVTRPVKELKGFRKVTLNPGEKVSVALDITPDSLAFFDIHMQFRVEPGEFDVMIGNSSRDADLQKVTLLVA